MKSNTFGMCVCLTFHYSVQETVILDVGYRLMITENDAFFMQTMTILVIPMTEYRL